MKAAVNLTGRNFELAKSALSASRKIVFEKWCVATDPPEKAYYSGLIDEYDALLTPSSAL